ncbi:hypothetical protein FKM82_009092 [Ascaphus truei]
MVLRAYPNLLSKFVQQLILLIYFGENYSSNHGCREIFPLFKKQQLQQLLFFRPLLGLACQAISASSTALFSFHNWKRGACMC